MSDFGQGDLFADPPDDVARARRSDPETSHAAARSITSDAIRTSQMAVYALLRRLGPMNDQELVVRYYQQTGGVPYQSPSGIRTRRSELVAAGLVRDSGDRATLDSGRQAIVWVAVLP